MYIVLEYNIHCTGFRNGKKSESPGSSIRVQVEFIFTDNDYIYIVFILQCQTSNKCNINV